MPVAAGRLELSSGPIGLTIEQHDDVRMLNYPEGLVKQMTLNQNWNGSSVNHSVNLLLFKVLG